MKEWVEVERDDGGRHGRQCNERHGRKGTRSTSTTRRFDETFTHCLSTGRHFGCRPDAHRTVALATIMLP
jgi:hypothetical protein